MKKTLLALMMTSLPLQPAWAQDLELKPLTDLMAAIEKSDFTYKEKGLLFGYMSAQSCLYTSPEIIIFKNYCDSGRNYPARGFTIISADYGMMDIYQEKIGQKIKRDFTLTEFSQNLAPYLTTPFPLIRLKGLSELMEKLYNQFNPGCWSTNWSHYTGQAETKCSPKAGNVIGLQEWVTETQEINGDEKRWEELLDTLENKIK